MQDCLADTVRHVSALRNGGLLHEDDGESGGRGGSAGGEVKSDLGVARPKAARQASDELNKEPLR
jgi:hypothetical protein